MVLAAPRGLLLPELYLVILRELLQDKQSHRGLPPSHFQSLSVFLVVI